MSITTASPETIDTELADLHYQLARADALVGAWIEDLRYATGEKPTAVDRRRNTKEWATTAAEVEAKARQLASGRCDRVLGELTTARGKAAALSACIANRDSEFRRRGGWTRFFLVDNNGGHIHSSMSCATCYPTTRFGWLPQLSGLTEAEAVAAHGPILCSVCYPSAPTEWTKGKPKAPRCDGSGKEATQRSRHGMRAYGNCRECGTRGQLTPNGVVRAHKPATATV